MRSTTPTPALPAMFDALRIATKRQDYPAILRLTMDTLDLTVGEKVDHPGFTDAQRNLAVLVGKEEADRQGIAIAIRHQRDRASSENPDNIHGHSIAQLEAQLLQIREIIESYRHVPANLTPIDTYMVAKDYERGSAKLLPLRSELEQVIERVRQSTYDTLVETERDLESGQRRPNVFERGRQYVETSLAKRAPDALRIFRSAEESIDVAGPEDLVHALTSCRRMIKALADALFPATGEVVVGGDGRERVMSDEAYRNRLLQFASDRISGTSHRGLTTEALRSLGSRLERLNELSSKGVHADVSHAEAESCVMWTYLTAADFLRIADGTSPLGQDGSQAVDEVAKPSGRGDVTPST